MKKKILHVSKYYFPFRGGLEQVARDCVTALKDMYGQKVFCFNHDNEQGDAINVVDGVDIVRAGCFAKMFSQSLSFSYGKLLKHTMEDFKPDIVIFHYPNPFAAHYILKHLEKSTKLIIYWHLDIIKQRFLRIFFSLQNKRLLSRADKIIATSPNYVEGSLWLQQVKWKCVVIPNCVSVDRFMRTPEVDEFAKSIRAENNGKIICLAVGRHTEYKGIGYLIEASKYLDNRFRFYIIGKGELTEKLKRQAKGDSKINFLGSISDGELKAYMSAMDIFCFPSITKNEAFGLALAEAMYYGKPSVTFTIPGSGVNYVSINGKTGIEVPNCNVVAYAEAIKKLADDRILREKFGEAAKKRVVEHFLDSSFANNIRREIQGV
ncbi:MAG: glycosyltransferase [Synergistaceae bacterium]|nr:glycosyltransferase [Synergistaceae bacterium]